MMRSLFVKLFSALLIGGLLWGAGFLYFTRLIPRVSPRVVMPTEGIVVFTGGRSRLQEALSLFEKYQGKYLLISGVNPDSTFPDMIASLPRRHQITLGYVALNTPGNADETAQWVRQHHIKTLRLITSNYHMPRSLFELRKLLPDVQVIPHPVMQGGVNTPRWWRDEGALAIVFQEYNKFLFALLRRPFEDLEQFLTLRPRSA